MNCKVKQGCLTSESCCILLWLAFTLFPVSVVTAADNRKIDESQQKEVKAEMKGYVGDENGEPVIGATVLESGTQNGVIRYIHYTVGKERIIDHFICWVPEENGSGKR